MAWNQDALVTLGQEKAALELIVAALSEVIKTQTVRITNLTIGSNGYTDISGSRPNPPNGYTLVNATIHNFGTVSSKDCISISSNGQWLIGTANATVTSIDVQYIFRRSS